MDGMRAYVLITGVLFLLLALVHVWRIYEEGASLAGHPHFLIITLIAVCLAGWAFSLYRRSRTT